MVPGAEAGPGLIRLALPDVGEEERSLESTVRPRRLDEFAGQQRIKENLAILIDAARQRAEPIDVCSQK